MPPGEADAVIEKLVDRVLAGKGYIVTREERLQFIEDTVADVTGLGPLESLLNDDSITEVMVNGPNQIYIERGGKILRVDVAFLNDEHVLRIIDRIITPLGRRIDDSSPRVDARLADGSRVNAIIAPLSLVGPVITVRKFAAEPFTVDDLIGFGTASAEMFDFLRRLRQGQAQRLRVGRHGLRQDDDAQRALVVHPERRTDRHDRGRRRAPASPGARVTLEARPANLEGEGEITIRDLLRNAMHMRPDRIIVGECRSGEALDMLQAMTTGHDGSLSTGHANSPRDMLRRIETMVLMTGYELPLWAIREQIASAVDLIVHTARLKDGSRKIINITEVYGIEDDEILTQDIFVFEQTGMKDGKVEGELKPTGFRPTFMGQFTANGVSCRPGEFGIPSPKTRGRRHAASSRNDGATRSASTALDASGVQLGHGRAVTAGGMIYVSAIGPVDPGQRADRERRRSRTRPANA